MRVQRIRLFIQLIAFILLTYGGYMAIDLGNSLPVFSCAYNNPSGGVCFFMPLQHLMATPFRAYTGWVGIRLLISFLTFIFLIIVLNKAWCGWVCPFGFIQDLLTRLRKFLKIEGAKFSWATRDNLKPLKYILLFLMIIIPIGIGNSFFGMPKLGRDLSAPFCQICPARPLLPLFNGDISQIFIDFSSPAKLILSFLAMAIFGLLAFSFMKRRFLCSYCPMSALMSLLERAGLMQLKKDSQRCTKCGNCRRVCDMDIRDVYEEKDREKLVTQDCMLCLKCIEACPEDMALKATFLGKPIFTSTIEGFLKRQRNL